MNNYLIPANSKNGQLILNLFKPADLVILAIGTVITVIFLFVFKEDTIPLLVAKQPHKENKIVNTNNKVNNNFFIFLYLFSMNNLSVFIPKLYMYITNFTRK